MNLPAKFFVVAALLASVSVTTTVDAKDVSGLAAMHDIRKEGRRLCMSDHFHQGASNGKSTKKAAMAAAVASWSDFTDLEYGRAWSRFSKAASKSMSCQQSSIGWGCDVEARPCQ